ncbi:MAG: O-antigen ligase family protein [Armatimonadetes bacterium]|nr:O-antigen ligase family protein [Armatimonadota bacterium]
MVAGVVLIPFVPNKELGLPLASYGQPVLFAMILLSAGLCWRRNGIPARHVRYAAMIGLLLLSAAASVVNTTETRATIKQLTFLATGFGLYLYLISSLSPLQRDGARGVERVVGVLVLSATGLALFFLYNIVVQAARHGLMAVLTSRTHGGLMEIGFATSNPVAGVLVFPLFVSIYAATCAESRAVRVLGVLGVCSIACAVLATLSRGTISCIAIGLVLLLLGVPGRAARGALLVIGAAALVLLALIHSGMMSADMLSVLWQGRWEGWRTETLSGRTEIWAYYWDMIASTSGSLLVFGRGIATTGRAYGYHAWGASVTTWTPHNSIMTLLLEQGVVGLVIHLTVIGHVLIHTLLLALRSPSPRVRLFCRIMGTGFLATLMHTMMDDLAPMLQYITYVSMALALLTVGPYSLRDRGVADTDTPHPGSVELRSRPA